MSYKEIKIEDYVKEDYKISEKLRSVTAEAIVKGLRNYSVLRYVGAIVVVFLIYIILINASSSFRAFASTIPGIKESVKWFYISRDPGLEKAVINESRDYGPLGVENDKYVIYIDHFIVDESRVSITAHYETKSDMDNGMLVIARPVEFGDYTKSSGDMVNDKEVTRIEISFGKSELKDILENDDELVVDLKLLDRVTEEMVEVGRLSVKVNPTDISLSRSYNLPDETTASSDYFVLEQLISYPSRTELLFRLIRHDLSVISRFENLSLQINKGDRIYAENSYGQYIDEENKESYLRTVFNDSCYYDDNATVTISYDGYDAVKTYRTISSVPLDTTVPFKVDCYGEVLWVENITFNEDSKLLDITMSRDKGSSISTYSIWLQYKWQWINKSKVTSPPTADTSSKIYTTFTFEDIESIDNCSISVVSASFYISDEKTFTFEIE